MNKIKVRDLCEITIIAALYVILTTALSPLSYGSIQFRLSEVLMLLVLYKKRYSISLILGCLISNIFSPVGMVDVLFGTLATVVAIIPMLFIKNMELSGLLISLANGLIVGIELSLVYELPLFITMAQVFIGEFVVVSLLGVSLFMALEKNEGFTKTLNIEPLDHKFKMSADLSLSIALFIVSLICFFKLSMYEEQTLEGIISNTLYLRARKYKYYMSISMLVLPLVILFSNLFLNKKIGLIIDIILSILCLSFIMYIIIDYNRDVKLSFYLYLLLPIFSLLIGIFKYKSNKLKENLE